MSRTLAIRGLRRVAGWLAACGLLAAQPTVAPTTESVGPTRGRDWSGYNIVQSFETGYRFDNVNGNRGKYRSDVNFGDGVRLLGSQLSVNSKEGHGHLLDELTLTTQGLGNDPYQLASLRVQKNQTYRYDLLWRSSDYFNPALAVAGGQHFIDTRRTLQDHNLVLLPQAPIRFHVGYTRNSQSGPALATTQLFDSRGDEFALFGDIRRRYNEYRVGGEVLAFGMKLIWQRAWASYREDTPYMLPAASPGNNIDDATALTGFQRREPYRGDTPSWRVNLLSEAQNWLAVNGRFTYALTDRDFVLDENAVGSDRLGTARNRQMLLSGSGRRPVTTADLTISVFPGSRVTLTNHTSYHHTRMEGEGSYRELNNSTLGLNLQHFQYLGIRAFTNSTDANYRASRWLGFYGGYHYSTRRIRSIEQQTFAGTPDRNTAEQDNRVHSGLAGVRLQPVKPLTLNLDAEVGRADKPFYPISERNYHALSARGRFKLRSLSLSAAARSNYNFNSVSLWSHSSRARNYSLDASWAPRDWFAVDTGYSKLHLDALTGIAYFLSNQLISGDRSVYVSNVHAGHLAARIVLWKRADFFCGFHRVTDTGDGRGVMPVGLLAGAQTLPLTFQSPLARLSVRLHNKVRWNFGYQFYDYGEKFLELQNYRAHTGYTSVLWSF